MTFDLEAMAPPAERRLPWDVASSIDISEAETIDDALSLAKLDWDVEQEPVYQKVPGDRKFRVVPNRVMNVRKTDREVLGIVTPRYNIVQQRDAFSFLQALIESEEAIPDRAGQLENGKLVFVTMKLPNDIVVPGVNDRLSAFIRLTNAHDGYRKLTASIEVIRLICTNGLVTNVIESSWGIKHTAFLSGKVTVARETLGITFDYLERFREFAGEMASVKIKPADAETLLKQIFPVGPNATEAQIERSQFFGAMETWRHSETLEGATRGTAWGLYNAVTEFVDHASKYRSKMMPVDESRAESILFGPGAWKKQRAFQVIREYVEAA